MSSKEFLTIHYLMTLAPYQIKELLDMELSDGENLMKQAWESKGKKSVELALRSLYDTYSLIDLRLYYLQRLAKTDEEKLLCMIENIAEVEDLIEEDENLFYSLVANFQFLNYFEYMWTSKKSRLEAYTFWRDFYLFNKDKNYPGLEYLILNRFPLFPDSDSELLDLLINTDNNAALVTYPKALIFYSKDSNSEEAKNMLHLSIELNPYVPPILLDKKRHPKKPNSSIQIGSRSEAEYLAFLGSESWWYVKGATEWLRKNS